MTAPVSRSPLVARTRRLDTPVALRTVAGADGVLFERRGSGLAGRGVAARVPVASLDAALASIERDDEVEVPGSGPVAFAALPFLHDDPADAVIPEVIVGRTDDGTRWVTTVSGVDQPAPTIDDIVAALTVSPTPDAGPATFTVTSARPPEQWCDAVVAARDAMKAGRLDKVVLARMVDVSADRPIAVATVLDRLAASYPDCYVFSIDGQFVGASPELLVARFGDIVRSHPMAGTTPRAGDPAVDARLAAALLASPKMREEHQITIDMVHDTLLPWCSYLDYEAEPGVVSMTNVQHLATLVEGRLSQPAPSVLELVQALHPTPAVCGSPREVALDLIEELEELDRGRYAGTVGWVDAAGNGAWAVSIRCADIDGAHAKLYAGNGIVADSDPDVELTETRAKLQALLSAIVRP